MGGGNHIFQLLSSKDIGGGEIALGVTMLSGLGDRDGEYLAGLSLDHHVTVWSAEKVKTMRQARKLRTTRTKLCKA